MWILLMIAVIVNAYTLARMWRRAGRVERRGREHERLLEAQLAGLRRDVDLLATREGIGGLAPTPRAGAWAEVAAPASQSGTRPRVTLDAPAEDETLFMERMAGR